LLVSDGAAWAARGVTVLPMVALLVLGLMKINVGVSRGRPVGFLVVLCVLTGIVALALLIKRPHRSRRGDRALARLKGENAALRHAPRSLSTRVSADDLALAVALFGTAVLVGGPLADLRTALMPPPSAGGGDCGSSCGGGGGCGGGCGGGGCGGCGS